MARVSIILGYGIPEDIFKDRNYEFYLKKCFNDIVTKKRDQKSQRIVIFSGGMTDCFPPYSRSEAREMLRYFEFLIAESSSKDHWKLITEDTSLSTLQNLVNVRRIIQENNITSDHITIFCEITRQKRVQKLAETIFSNSNVRVSPMNFYKSSHTDDSFHSVENKERCILEQDIKSLSNKNYFEQHIKFYKTKFDILRNTSPSEREDKLKQLWEEAENFFNVR
jgi:hypothetical protein